MATYTALVAVLLEPSGTLAERRFTALQRIRHMYDAAYSRWLPHITLIPPFRWSSTEPMSSTDPPPWLQTKLHALTQDLQAACALHHSHTLTLSDINTFRLRRYSNVHLRPDQASGTPLVALQRDLARAAQLHLPTGAKRKRERFIPHASLGQAYSCDDQRALFDEARQTLGATAPEESSIEDGGLRVRIHQVQVMYKPSTQKGPYTIWSHVPLRD